MNRRDAVDEEKTGFVTVVRSCRSRDMAKIKLTGIAFWLTARQQNDCQKMFVKETYFEKEVREVYKLADELLVFGLIPKQ